MKLTMTKGLPASGKTTWALEMVRDYHVSRINKDDLRAMLHGGRFSRSNEKAIVEARDAMIEMCLSAGRDVIVDDTNLHPKHEARLRELAAKYGAEFEVKDFTDVPVKECVARDLKRTASVGSKVIRRMHSQFLANRRAYEPEPGRTSPVVIVDIDGTLAHMNGRGPYDATQYHTDLPDPAIVELVSWLRPHCEIVIMSGRDEAGREVTEQWLDQHGIHWDEFYMRKAGDRRDDAIVKEELFDAHVRGRNVRFVLDDRDRVVDMWRRIGLTCLQVADGDF